MAYPAKLLSPGETVQFELKPHWRALFVPIIVLLLTVFGMVLLYFWIDTTWFGGTFLRWVVLVVGILILALWAIRPFLRSSFGQPQARPWARWWGCATSMRCR